MVKSEVSGKSEPRRVVVCWFRRDLRLEDNRALSRAFQLAQKLDAEVLPLFIFDGNILKALEDRKDARVTFIYKTLANMKLILTRVGSDLLCAHGDPLHVWTTLLAGRLAVNSFRVTGAAFSHDYEPAAIERDKRIARLLAKHQIPMETCKDQVIFERDEVTKDDEKPYTVFTPYSKKWRARLNKDLGELRVEKCSPNYDRFLKCQMPPLPTLEELGFSSADAIEFPSLKVETKILKKYANERDQPAMLGTSRLGMHLRFGTVSVRAAVATALKLHADAWLNELIWREFFMQILWHFPHVVGQAFRPAYELIRWRNDEREFRAWCEGRTGYPLVDAGMRELNATGFMHNRVRMVAASFLVKHLLIDWRWGEAYFAQKLLDFDLSANNGNWQWVAGSGCDAAPYFRIFNPDLQLKKFDSKFAYVRKWIPEFETTAYPAPIVEHREARERALRAFSIVSAK